MQFYVQQPLYAVFAGPGCSCLYGAPYSSTTIMQTLFGLEKDNGQGIVSVPAWNYVRLGLLNNLKTVVSYYRRFPLRIDASHFLIKLIFSLGVSRNQPVDRFYADVQSRALNAAMTRGMTTSISKGQLFDSVFYGGCKEIIIGHDEDFDFVEAERNWRDLQPVRILHHPITDLGLNVPDGERYSLEDGLAVIAINIPMLALQYREFRRYEDELAERTGENPRSIANFLYSYPLLNAMGSHLDAVVFNRLYHLLKGYPMGVSQRRHPFYLTDYSANLDAAQKTVLEVLAKNHRKFDGVMRSVPLIVQDNLAEFARLPDVAATRQVLWGLAAARLQLLSFLFQAQRDDPYIRNASEVNRIVKNFRLWNTDKALSSSLPVDLYFDLKSDLTKVIPP